MTDTIEATTTNNVIQTVSYNDAQKFLQSLLNLTLDFRTKWYFRGQRGKFLCKPKLWRIAETEARTTELLAKYLKEKWYITEQNLRQWHDITNENELTVAIYHYAQHLLLVNFLYDVNIEGIQVGFDNLIQPLTTSQFNDMQSFRGLESPLRLEPEIRVARELFEAQKASSFSNIYAMGAMVLAQHYGIPTSLLDFTTKPLIAAFFAANTKNVNDEIVVYALNECLVSTGVKLKINGLYETIDGGEQAPLMLINPAKFCDLSYNINIQRQAGVFIHFKYANKHYFSKGAWPTLEDMIANSHMNSVTPPKKLILEASCREHLLRILANSDVYMKFLEPSLKHVADEITSKIKA